MTYNPNSIDHLKVTDHLFNKAFPLRLNLSTAQKNVFKVQYLIDGKFDYWMNLLGSVDLGKMVNLSGNTLSLFHDTLRIKISKKGVEVKTPRFKGDFYNEVLSNQYVENNLLSALLGVNSQNNIIGLISLGILVNGAIHSDEIHLPSTKQEHIFLFLKMALTTNKEDFDTLVQDIEENEHVEILRQYNAHFSPIKQELEKRLMEGLTDLFGLEQSQKDNLEFLSKAIDQYCSNLRLTSSPLAFIQEIVKKTPIFCKHMRIIERNEPALLESYVTGFYKAADYQESLDDFVARVEDVVQAIDRGEKINYTRFYSLTHNKHDYMVHIDNWLIQDIDDAVTQGFDPLKINYKAFGVVSLIPRIDSHENREKHKVNSFDLKKSIALLSKYWLNYSEDGQYPSEAELIAFARKMVLDFNGADLYSALILEYMTTFKSLSNYDDQKGYAEKVLMKIIQLVKQGLETKDSVQQLESQHLLKIDPYNIRPELSSPFLFGLSKEFAKYTDDAISEKEFLINIRKIITLGMIGSLIEKEVSMNVNELNLPEQVEVDGVTLNKINSWQQLYDLYSQNNLSDNFITSANYHYLKEMASYAAIYKTETENGVLILIMEAVRSNMKAALRDGADYIFDLHTVSSTHDIKPEYYQIGFHLKKEMAKYIKYH